MYIQKFLKSLFIISVILIISNDGFTQISKGGTPPSFSNPSLDSVQVFQMPEVNVDSLLQNDTIDDFSYRFGYAIDVDMLIWI